MISCFMSPIGVVNSRKRVPVLLHLCTTITSGEMSGRMNKGSAPCGTIEPLERAFPRRAWEDPRCVHFFYRVAVRRSIFSPWLSGVSYFLGCPLSGQNLEVFFCRISMSHWPLFGANLWGSIVSLFSLLRYHDLLQLTPPTIDNLGSIDKRPEVVHHCLRAPPYTLAADLVRHGAAKLKPVGLCTLMTSPGESFTKEAVSDHMLRPSSSRKDHTPE